MNRDGDDSGPPKIRHRGRRKLRRVAHFSTENTEVHHVSRFFETGVRSRLTAVPEETLCVYFSNPNPAQHIW
jgi:hypothetical protein